MNLRLFAFLFFIALTAACNNSTRQDPFSISFTTKGELCISGEKLADPGLINITDKYLILGNNEGQPLIEVYDISTKELLNSFLYIGNGPSEVLTIGNIQLDIMGDNMYVSDLFKRNLFQYCISEIAKNEKITPTVVFERGENSPFLYDKMYVGKSHLIAESRDPRGRIILIDPQTREANYFLSYPDKKHIETKIPLGDIAHARLYSSSMTINFSFDKVALGTYHAGILDICQIKNGEVISEWSHTDFYPQGVVAIPMGEEVVAALSQEARSGYRFMCSSDKFVYALYSGEISDGRTDLGCKEVRVVSWNGKETYKIILDHPIVRLAVDPNDKFIYAITPEMDILRFPIIK